MFMRTDDKSTQEVLDATVHWLEQAVIGLNLCPFAKSVHVKKQIHYHVYQAADASEWLEILRKELMDLAALEPEIRDTSLLMAPNLFADFLDFNDFLHEVDKVVDDLKLQGTLQVASFHPHFQFAGTDDADITNYTNRAPYPTLHLIRESSIDRAVQAFPEAEMIFEKNMQTLQQLGIDGWQKLGLRK